MVNERNVFPEWLPRQGIENIVPDGAHGRVTVTGTGSGDVIQLPVQRCQGIVIKAHPSNDDIVSVGMYPDLVLSPTSGFALGAGDSLAFRTNDVSNVGVVSEATGTGLVPAGTGVGVTGVACWFAESLC